MTTAHMSHQTLTSSVSFHETYADQIHEAARIYGIEGSDVRDTNSLHEQAQKLWLPGDHTTPIHPVDINEKGSARLKQLYGEMNLLQENRLPSGEYDQLVALGGTHTGNHRRLAFLNEELFRGDVATDTILLLGGVRRADPSERVLIAEDIKQLEDKETADPWVSDVRKGHRAIETETDMFRLAIAFQLGSVAVRSESADKVVFEHNDKRVVLLNSRAVKRAGPPRHTTESSVADWMRLETPKAQSEVGLIATNPHTLRTARTAQRIIGGRAKVVGAGPASRLSHRHELFRGEIARHLYEDSLAS